ncbi:MAG TPA: GNAT family N-acetyltransferase [Bryobacteraceae bacterium]|nr:GNAT family N-acetyltransferase [Bryobacteraceae bacterium]
MTLRVAQMGLVEFRPARLPEDLRGLVAFDRKVFPSDHFPASEWRRYESWWMLLDGRKIGCCAFEPHVDFTDDLDPAEPNQPRRNSLYIASTGILPRFQGQGFGQLLKAWEIAWAAHSGFNRIVTNTRQRNAAMIALNRKFGFRVLRTTPRYYRNPVDATVVMELRLRKREI